MSPDNERIMMTDIAEIRAKLDATIEKFSDHILQGNAWRTAIIGILAVLIIQIVSFAYMYGKLSETVHEHGKSLAKMEIACVDVQRHVLEDEARWQVFDPKEYLKHIEN